VKPCRFQNLLLKCLNRGCKEIVGISKFVWEVDI
jgi:hypothetical protein